MEVMKMSSNAIGISDVICSESWKRKINYISLQKLFAASFETEIIVNLKAPHKNVIYFQNKEFQQKLRT